VFRVVVNHSESGLDVVIEGEFDLVRVGYVTGTLEPHLAHCVRLDLGTVSFIDSSALQCLLRLRAEAATHGGQLAVGLVSPVVRRLFDLAGIADMLRTPRDGSGGST